MCRGRRGSNPGQRGGDPAKAKDDTERRQLLIMRGDAQLGAGRPREALAEFERALALDANDVAARLGLASARFETDGFAAAKSEADLALARAPQDPRAHLTMATLYLRDRQFEAAAKGFDVTVKFIGEDERDNNLVVRAELPGLSNDDVKVKMTDEGLVIQGERKREREEKGEGWYRSERSYGQFYRLIPLPEGVNAEQAKARFENGVLEVSIPIPESRRSRRSIPIETGGGSSKK